MEFTRLVKTKNGLDYHQKIDLQLEFPVGINVENHYIKGICVVPERRDILVSVPNGQCIQVLDMCGNLKRHIVIDKGSWEPLGICYSHGKLFVCDYQNKKIQIFNHEYEHVSSFDTQGLDPECICAQSNGNIVVSSSDSCISIFDPNGHVIVNSYAMTEWYKRLDVGGICCNRLDEILILDMYENGITKYDQNGFFASRQYVANLPFRPDFRGICIDEKSNTLVCDYMNGAILILDSNGKHINGIPCKQPQAICLFEEIIIVATWKSIVLFSN